MSSDVVLSVRDLQKTYSIRHNQSDHVTLAEVALHRIRHPFSRAERETFVALDEVSFDVGPSEVLGIVGRNGAGKSTLLKILSRITPPSKGQVSLWGKVGSLLEVGTGFHPELTGRENIYLNGSMLGMSRGAIQTTFDRIVDFAGVAQFLDTPVKRYSSGMYVRLAFAVAAHLESDILLLDEVLAVGDSGFQAQCMRRIAELRSDGRTVLLVSHQAHTLQSQATRALLLVNGRLHMDGEVDSVLGVHEEMSREATARDADRVARASPLWGKRARLRRFHVDADGPLRPGDVLPYRVEVDVLEPCPPLRFTQILFDVAGTPLATAFTEYCVPDGFVGSMSFDVCWPTTNIADGTYTIGIVLGTGDQYAARDDLDYVAAAVDFAIRATDEHGTAADWRPYWGHFHLDPPTVLPRGTNGSGNVVAPDAQGPPIAASTVEQDAN